MGVLASIPPPPTNGVRVGPLFFHIYGLMIALGVLAAVTLARRRWQARGHDPEELDRPMLWAVAAGFLGGRLAYVSTHLGSYTDRPWAVLAIWEGGLALYGGLTLGIATGMLVARRRRLPVLQVLDAAIPGIPLAQAFGRWGNYFNQELFGTPTQLPWGLEVDPAYRPDNYQDATTFHPTFLYESLYNLLVVWLLLRIDARRRLRPGSLALCYGVLYGTGRFLLELLRTDTTFRLLGISRNGYVSIAVVVACATALWLRERRRLAREGGEEGAEAGEEAGQVSGSPGPAPADSSGSAGRRGRGRARSR